MPAKATDRLDRNPQEWRSPAFLKRKEPSSTTFVNSIYDPFGFGHDYREMSPSKRTKFSRKSREWRFADQSPSPAAEANIGIVEDYGMPQEVVKKKTVVEDPSAIQAELQTLICLETDAQPPVAVISSDRIATFNQDISQSDERLSRDIIGDDGTSTVSVASFRVSSPQVMSPDAPDTGFKSKEHILPIQDTYDRETVSAPSPTADPSMEVVTGILYGGEHVASENSPSAKRSPVLSPAQVQSSPDQPSRSTSSFLNRPEVSEHGLAVQNNNVGSIIQNELAVDKAFSEGAYTPPETGDSLDIGSEDLEVVENLSDDASDHQRRDYGPINSTHEVDLPPTDFIQPSPSYFGHDYDELGFSRVRRYARSVSISSNQADEMATAAAVHTSPSHTGASIGDSADGFSPEKSKIKERIQGAGVEQVLSLPAIVDTQLKADAKELLPGRLTTSALPLDKSNKTKLVLSGSVSFNEDTEARQGQDVMYEPLDKSSGRGATRESKATVQEEHEASPGGADSQAKSYEASLGNDECAFGPEPDVALSLKSMSINNKGRSEDKEIDDDGSALVKNSESASENISRAELVEIIDVDEYDRVELPEVKSDLAQSVEGDYWSDEELQYQTDPRSGSEEDDEFSSEDEHGSFADDYEEDDMREDDSALVPDTSEQSGQGQYFRSMVKTPYVEIIDLESDDGIEPTEPFGDDPNVPHASSAVPDIEGISNTKSVLALGEEGHNGATELAQQEIGHQPKADNYMVASEQPQMLVKSLSKSRGEVQDSYSEDAALSDTESPESLLAVQVEGRTQLLQRFTESSQNAVTISRNLPASTDLDIELNGEQISKSKSHVQQGEGYSVTPSGSSTHEERITIRGNDDLAEPMHSQDQDFSGSTVQYDELPNTQPSNTSGQTTHSIFMDDEAYSARTALDVPSTERNSEMPKHYDKDLNEQEIGEHQSKDLRDRSALQSQLLTPNDTQSTSVKRETSNISKASQDEPNTFPTPSLTQRTSDILAPVMPMPQAPTLIEKLKEMRSNSARKRQASLSDELLTGVSPWFGESKSSHLHPLSDHESLPGAEEETGRDGDVSSEAEQSELDREPTLPIRRAVTPSLSSVFTRLPSSSPPAHFEPEHGFRTSLSYFAPLSMLRSHYNSTTSVLALVVTSTDITRAATGPKDYHMTVYVTDPSSSLPSLTSARLFRPSKYPFPEARQGDAILLRNFRVVSYRKQLGLLSTDSSAWAIFRRGEEPQIRGPPVEFGAEERGFARGLWYWWGTVQQDKYVNAVPERRQGREVRSAKGRSSIVRHELRDGTTYVDRPKVENTAMHELRDGTQWSDSKL